MQIKSLIVGVATFLLVACGGGSDSDTDSGSPPPTGGTPPPPLTKAAAVSLLEQATFGTRLNDIDDVLNRGIEGWIDRQLNLSPSPHLRYYDIVTIADNDTWSQHVNAWWMRSIRAEDQLRQRVAFALSQILVIGQSGVNGNGINGARSISNYYDVLLINGLGNWERDLASDPEALLDHLDLLLLAEKMSPELRQAALDFMATYGEENFEEKAADAIGLIITSPEFAVQQ